MPAFEADSADPKVPGLTGKGPGHGVWGESTQNGTGVVGKSAGGIGVYGESTNVEGLRGVGHKGAGVSGTSEQWIGVYGESQNTEGVRGVGHKGAGVSGTSEQYVGVYGESSTNNGVFGLSHHPFNAAVSAVNDAGGFGLWAEAKGGHGIAAHFQGDAEVTGDIKLVNADCAEDFNIGVDLSVEPGTVMVLGEEGALFPSLHAYDKRVAGVISGGGDYKPGIVLDKQESGSNRQPVALLGKVFCKVDAQYGAIEVGDLLTTAPTPGHAMKADDPQKAFGAVIGKALRPLAAGQGLIPILIALQ